MRRLGLVGLLLVAAALTATPSSATKLFSESFSGPYTDGYDDCGFDVVVEGVGSGRDSVRVGKGKNESAFFGHTNYSFVETHTNPATGAFFTLTGDGNFTENKAIRRPEEGPNVFQFWATEAGQFTIYDADGNLVAVDRGSLKSSILFDTEGDAEPGGILVEFLEENINGRSEIFDNFCDIATELIG